MGYFFEVWSKPNICRSAMDDITITAELILAISVCCLLFYGVCLVGKKRTKKRRK